MKLNSQTLISDLINATNFHIERTENFLKMNDEELNKRTENKWTILECCEHLNEYFMFYLPEISKKIKNADSTPSENFASGILGNYFAKSMLRKENFKKMKSPKDKNPFGKNLTKNSVQNLIQNLNALLNLLERSKSVNLEKIKIEISISKLMKLKLGDAFRFLVNHNERHLQQAEKLR